MNQLYLWIDALWQKIAETIFVRFEFDTPVEELHQLSREGRLTFTLTHGGLIEWLILSSWCRKNGLGAILIANRKRILLFSKPLCFLQALFRRKSYAQLFLSDETGPRLILCPTSERKKPFIPTPVERLISQIYSMNHKEQKPPSIIVPIFILWRKHVRGETRSPVDYLLGVGSRPSFIGKLWYLLRKRQDSYVKSLKAFRFEEIPKEPNDVSDSFEETEALLLARKVRRRILVTTFQEMRVVLGPRQVSPHSVKETILRDPQVQASIERLATEQHQSPKKVMMQAYKNLTEIVAKYQHRSIQICYFILSWVFTRVYDEVNVREEEIQAVREVSGQKPIVYISCHRSHLDYLVLPYLLFDHNMVVPHIAAGINLSFWPIGAFLRSSGAFFIRRSFRGDPLYRLCLEKYLEYLLKNRFNFSFFIEGTRSRTGKMLPPAYGLLKMVLGRFEQRVTDDIALVPISISYDQVPEVASYGRELEGGRKVKESARSLIESRKILDRKLEKVYLRFGKPIFAKDFLKEEETLPQLQLQKTAFSLCKQICDISPITPKAILASVLLATPRAQLSLSQILETGFNLGDFAKTKGIEVTTPTEEGLRQGIEQTVKRLEKPGIVLSDDSVSPKAYFCSHRKRATLNYYKNSGLHCYVLPSITLLSLFDAIRAHKGGEADSAFFQSVFATAIELRNILKFEFFFNPTSEFLKEVRESGDFFFGKGWEKENPHEVVGKLRKGPLSYETYAIYPRLLGDLIEGYLVALTTIEQLPQGNYDKKKLIQKILEHGRFLKSQGKILFPEGVSTQIYSSALLFLENQNCVKLKKNADGTSVEFLDWNEKVQQVQTCLETSIETLESDVKTLLSGFSNQKPTD